MKPPWRQVKCRETTITHPPKAYSVKGTSSLILTYTTTCWGWKVQSLYKAALVLYHVCSTCSVPCLCHVPWNMSVMFPLTQQTRSEEKAKWELTGIMWDTPSYSARSSRERATDKLLNLWQLADKCRRKGWGHSCSKCSTGVSNSHWLTGCMYCTPFSCGLHCVLFSNGATELSQGFGNLGTRGWTLKKA